MAQNKIRASFFTLTFITLITLASFQGFYQKWQFRETVTVTGVEDAKFALSNQLNATASRPYVFRFLLPYICNKVNDRLPPETGSRLLHQKNTNAPTFLMLMFDSPLARTPSFTVRYLVMYGLDLSFAWMATFFLFQVGLSLGHTSSHSLLGTAFLMLLLPFLETVGGYYYDYPELAFFALAFLIILRFSIWWIFPLAVLATLNKETFFFFIPTLYPLVKQRIEKNTAIFRISSSCILSGGTYIAISHYFRMNPGGSTEWHLPEQLYYFSHFFSIKTRENTYGIMQNQFILFLIFCFIVLIVATGIRRINSPLKAHAIIAIIINLPLYFFLCAPGELRNFSLCYLSFFSLLLACIHSFDQPPSISLPM